MSVVAREGVIAFGRQAGRSDAVGFTLPTNWHRFKATGVNLGGVQLSELWPLEVGGTPFRSGQRKTAAMVGGQMTFQPRLKNMFGHLLTALTGSVCTADNMPATGLATHIFRPNPACLAFLPWFAMRKLIPGAGECADESTEYGEQMVDIKFQQMTFNFAAMAPLTAQATVMGRIPNYQVDPINEAGWAWYNDYENVESVPTGNVGHLKLPEFDVNPISAPVLQATFRNMLSSERLQNEMIIGSYYLDDIVAVDKSLALRFVLKWADPDLYQLIFTGALDGTDWSPEVYNSNVEASLFSPAPIPGYEAGFVGGVPTGGALAQHYEFTILAPEVDWVTDGALQLAGQNILTIPIQGVAREPEADPENIWHIRVVNEILTTHPDYYTWPTL